MAPQRHILFCDIDGTLVHYPDDAGAIVGRGPQDGTFTYRMPQVLVMQHTLLPPITSPQAGDTTVMLLPPSTTGLQVGLVRNASCVHTTPCTHPRVSSPRARSRSCSSGAAWATCLSSSAAHAPALCCSACHICHRQGCMCTIAGHCLPSSRPRLMQWSLKTAAGCGLPTQACPL